MGLDAICNDIMIKCGSYNNVTKMHTDLICALKSYLELEAIIDQKSKDQMIDILVKVLNDDNELYRTLNHCCFKKYFSPYDLDGFFPFLAIVDYGCMTPYESRKFLKTYKIVKDHLNSRRERIVFERVLTESIKTSQNVQFI